MEEFGVYEQLQREEKHHQDDAGNQDTVETSTEQTDLPKSHSTATAGLQPVGPDGRKHTENEEVLGSIYKAYFLKSVFYCIKESRELKSLTL